MMLESRGCAHGRVSQIGRCRTNLCFRRSSNARKRIHRPASAVASAEIGIVNRLIGQPLLQLDQSRSVVPLLLPVEHQLPFAAALLIYRPAPVSSDSAAAVERSISPQINNTPTSESLVELSYILSGTGHFSSSSGAIQHVAAGDSILAVLGEIQFAAGSPHAAAEDSSSSSTNGGSSSNVGQFTHKSWWNLVPWLQHNTHSHKQTPHKQSSQQQQRQQQQAAPNAPIHQQQQQLVMLQLLLPSELLTGELDHYHPGHLSAVAQQLPWAHLPQAPSQASSGSSGSSSGSSSSTMINRLDQRDVCELLAGVFGPLQQQQQQQLARVGTGNGSSDSSSNGSSDSSSSGSSAEALSSRGDNDNNMSSSSSSSSSTLPSVGHQSSSSSCVKRTLSEVNSFQLPAQTNRLALLFGPHASPAVCLSFGVELFEPGHVTPLHIHSNAHELFFVLAGRGVAVHGPGGIEQSPGEHGAGGVERTEMTAGDVAVFPPGVLHGVDNLTDQQLYCLQMMLPNESFVEWVRSGQAAGAIDVSKLQQLAAAASCGA